MSPSLKAIYEAWKSLVKATNAYDRRMKEIDVDASKAIAKVDPKDPKASEIISKIGGDAADQKAHDTVPLEAVITKAEAAYDNLVAALTDGERTDLFGLSPTVALVTDTADVAKIKAMLKTLSDTDKELIHDMDNMSAFTSLDLAVGYINREKYLQVPSSLQAKLEAAYVSQKASSDYADVLTVPEAILMAADNLKCFPQANGAEFLCLIRAYTASIFGIPKDTTVSKVRIHEIKITSDPVKNDDVTRIINWIKGHATTVRSLRYIAINFMCLTNHVLLSLRSHYKKDPSFDKLWDNGFKSLLITEAITQSNVDKATLCHDTIHPWGLFIPSEAHRLLVTKSICDNSMAIRLRGGACGTAAYTGAAALIEQMSATKLFDRFFQTKAAEIKEIREASVKIKDNREVYSLNHRFYGVNDSPKLPEGSLVTVAPVVMAYRDVFLKTTSFKDIKSIEKIAQNAQGLRKILAERMKLLVKDAATRVEDIV